MARIQGYGTDPNEPLNGAVVEPGLYLESMGFFEVHLVDPIDNPKRSYAVGDTVLCKASELKPLNRLTYEFIEDATTSEYVVYDDEVYDLRDRLAEVEIFVTAESVNTWTKDQRERVAAWARVAKEGKLMLIKPEVLR